MPAITHAATDRQLRSVATIAAPLLAAAAITVVGVIVQAPSALAYPNAALGALALAAGCLVTSVNSSIWASYYAIEPIGPTRLMRETPEMSDEAYARAVKRYDVYVFWVNMSRRTYMWGVYALWTGLAIALFPAGNFQWWRVVGIAALGGALLVEGVLWRVAPRAPTEPSVWLVDE